MTLPTDYVWPVSPGAPAEDPPAAPAVPAEGDATVLEVNVIASDELEVVFNMDMAVNDALRLKDNFTVDETPGSGVPVTVKEVIVPKGVTTTSTLRLIVTEFSVGEEYLVIVSDSISTPSGEPISHFRSAPFVGRRTKVDAVLNSMPALFAKGPKSSLRAILTSIGRSDDAIGGSRRDRLVGQRSYGRVPPRAAFNSVVNGLEVTFDNDSTAGDAAIVLYAWDFGDGNVSSEVNPVHTYATDGNYTVILTVTDDDGVTDDASAVVTANELPVAGFSFAIDVGEVTFTNTSTDAESDIVSYAWNFGDGSTSTEANPVHTYTFSGLYTVTLVVTDGYGATDTFQDDVTVDIPIAPVAGFSAAIDTLPVVQSVHLDRPSTQYASISDGAQVGLDITGALTIEARILFHNTDADPDFSLYTIASKRNATGGQVAYSAFLYRTTVGVLQFRFQICEDGVSANEGIYRVSASHLSTDTWYRVAFRFDPAAGATFASRCSIFIDGVLRPMLLVSGADTIDSIFNSTQDFSIGTHSGASNPFNGSISDVRVWSVARTNSEIASTDPLTGLETGLQGWWQLDGDFTDSSPNGNTLTAVNSPTFNNTFQPVAFTDTSSDNGVVSSWEWDFGDGTSTTLQNPEHVYLNPGPYTVTLTVTDDDGLTDDYVNEVTALDPANELPVAGFTFIADGMDATFTDTSTDADGAVVRWEWDFGDGTSSFGTTNGLDIVKTAADGWGTGSAFSNEFLAGDGYVERRASETETARYIGLNSTNGLFTELDYGLGTNEDSTLYAYENGVIAYTGTYATGDILRINRTGTTVTYLKNGVVYYTSGTPAVGNLYVDVEMHTQGSTLKDIHFVDNGVDTPLTWASQSGITITSVSNPIHTYAAEGLYTVSLTVTDDDGEEDTFSDDVTIAIDNVLPTASFSAEQAVMPGLQQKAGAVSYIYPTDTDWDTIRAAGTTVGVAIMNPFNGPGYGTTYESGSVWTDYTAMLSATQAVGIPVVHYLSQNYRDAEGAHGGDPYAGTVGVNFRFSADSGTDVFTATQMDGTSTFSHGWNTGFGPLQVKAWNGGVLPGGVTAGTNYWFIRVSSTTFKLATSLANAEAGTAVNITSNGSGGRYIGISRTLANIQNVYDEIDLVLSRYPTIDGFFFDELKNDGDADDITWITSVYNYVKSLNPDLIVVQNPGAGVPESYVDFFDICMRFENTWAVYEGYSHPAWMASYPASKWWDAIHTASGGDEVALVDLARENNAGYVSFNGSSFSSLPATWENFITKINDENAAAGSIAAQRQFPEGSAEWTSTFPDISGTPPDHIWTWQEASGNVIDVVGAADLVPNYTAAYQQAGETEPSASPRYGIETVTTDVSERFDCNDTAVGNAALGSMTLLLRFKMPNNGTTDRSIFGKGTGGTSIRGYIEGTTGKICFIFNNAVTVKTASAYDDNTYHDVMFVIDRTGDLIHIITATEDVSASIAAYFDTDMTNASALRFLVSSGTTGLAGTGISYAALWADEVKTAADMTAFRVGVSEVQFTDESTDSDGTIVGWFWDFGDSTTSTSQNPVHTYAPGTYSVSLTVTDSDGGEDVFIDDVVVV